MMGYERVKLGEVASIRGGKRLPAGKDFITTETAHPYIRARDIGGGKVEIHEAVFLDEAMAQKLSRYTVNKGDVCLTIVGANVGEMGVVPPHLDGANLTENAVKIVTNGKADQTFLKYALLGDDALGQMKVLAGGAAQPKLGIYKIETIEFPLPPLPMQQRIAGILSAYDELMENSQRRIRILESMARALYREWFVYFRFPGHEKLPRVASALGDIPQGWEGRFGDLATIEREGINPFEFPDEEFEHFSIPAFDNGRQPVIELGATILSGKYCIYDSTVLLSKLNPRIPRIWLPVPSGQRRAITSTEFLGLKPQSGVTREFIYAKCCSDEFAGQFGSLAIGTSTSHQRVKPENLLAMPSTVPNQKTIATFTKSVSPMLGMSQKLRSQIQNLRRTRDLLLPRLLSGQIDVEAA
jgi:type I restriction enzyme, S subunit